MKKINLFELDYSNDEIQGVNNVLKSKWITMGPITKEFENKFSETCLEGQECIAVSSCTASLHLSLIDLNLKSDDEVLIPALTFIADVNVVKMVGAKPVLVDITSETDWNISIEDLKQKINDKTKAIIVVHFAGYPCEMDKIINLCKDKNIKIIEDCAHAPNASFRNKKIGTFGDYACFSFFTNKNLSVGEGGIVTSKNRNKQLRLMRSHGMSSLTIDRHNNKTISYDVILPGLNYRIDEIRSSLGLAQLKKLKKNNNRREELVKYYIKKLAFLIERNFIKIPFLDYIDNINYKNSYHIFPILLNNDINREELILFLRENGIQTSIHYPDFHDFSFYKEIFKDNPTPIASDVSKRCLTLPLYPNLKEEEIDYIVSKLKNFIYKK